jgi:DNA invertase Pin-like site-specific DNA recombinase
MASHGGFIAYYRVSTSKQGKSGLGIEGQRVAVENYLNGGNWRIIAEFVEVESGRQSDRPELDKALAAARLHRVPLVVAKVDRLTRSVGAAGRNRLVERANERAGDLAPTIVELQAAGITSLRGIAAALNERGIPPASGRGGWSAVQVSRALARCCTTSAKETVNR